jgi:hypothetical protein
MNGTYTAKERAHLNEVKQLPCSVCDAPGPSEAHHISQALPYTCIALCVSCHRDEHNGWHGRKAMWRIRKLDELAALNITLGRLLR